MTAHLPYSASRGLCQLVRRPGLSALVLTTALAVAAGCGDEDTTGTGASGTGATGAGGNTGGGATGGSGAAAGGTAPSCAAFDAEGWHPSSERDPCFFEQPTGSFAVHPSHPRLYFRSDDVDWLLARGQGPLSELWSEIEWMASSMAAEDPAGSTATDSVGGWYGSKGQAVALLAVLQQDATYRAWATAWAKAIGALDMPTDDGTLRERLERLAVVYDWLHDSFSEADRAEIYDAVVRYVEMLRDWGYIQNPGYIGGHERYGYATFAMGLLAIQGEYADADALLAQCREHIVHGFYPAQAWIAADGGYHMGWAYTASYTNFDLPYLVWTVGTNDVVLDDWIARTCDWYVQGLEPNLSLPPAGDAFSTAASLGTTNCIYAEGIGNRSTARWFLENAIEPTSEALLQLLLFDPDVTAAAPDAPSPDGQPLGRHFRTAGLVTARDGWDDAATHFTFKSGSFFSINHHHRDENTFTLYFQSPLALDSGHYDEYGSEHWRNYFTRTIAHNGVVVFDPAQEMTLYGDPVSNDGGQIFAEEPRELADLQPGGHASLDGIVRFETRDELTYAWGDASKAYDPARVSLAQREVVYLRDLGRPHPAIAIFDRVTSTSAAFDKRVLLHTVNEPALSGALAVAEHGAGRLTSATVYPADAQLAVVGGAGSEFLVDGTNYPIDPDGNEGPVEEGLFPGSWRLEVGPATAATEDYFLHVLFVDDVGAAAVAEADALRIDAAEAIGVQLADWVLVFPRSATGVSSLTYSTPVAGTVRHLVTGFEPGQSVTYAVDGSAIGSVEAGEGGCVLFEATTGAGASVSLE